MMLRRIVLAAALLLGVGVAGPMTQPAQACPMCKIANEQDSLLPQAYMYSILFMMGMMFTIGGGIGFGMYLLGRKENAAIEGWEQLGGADTEPGADGSLPGGMQPATT
ncbi:MAG: hypothetical protein IAG10_30560 [Planctomycetaceae bacterium]|nr:hypothetical protein [Planctomycetaceae bacterium]